MSVPSIKLKPEPIFNSFSALILPEIEVHKMILNKYTVIESTFIQITKNFSISTKILKTSTTWDNCIYYVCM